MSLRKHFLNKLLLATIMLSALALPLGAQAAPLYQMTLLPQDFAAAAVDGSGRVVGTAQGGAALWSPNSTTYLAALLPGSEGLAISSGGSIAGRIGNSAFVYAGGTVSTIDVQFAYGTWATAINDAGQVAGFGSLGFSETSAFLYQNGITTPLGSFGGLISVANAINAGGHIAGFASRPGDGDDWGDPERYASVYRDGVQHDLGSLGGLVSEANDINDAGFVAGWSELGDLSSERPFLFNPLDNQMIDLGTLGGVSGRANALNNEGLVVGLSGLGSLGDFDYRAFLYGSDGMLDLNALVGNLGDWTLVNATDINDAGQILAQVCRNVDDCRSVRLDLVNEVPEPGSWALIGAGLALLLLWHHSQGRSRRRGTGPRDSFGPRPGPHSGPQPGPHSGPQRRRHRIWPALLAAPAIGAVQAQSFDVTFIPAELNARAINSQGHVAGTNGAAAWWDGATIRDYAVLAPGSFAQAINNRGHLAGTYVSAAHVFAPLGLRNAGRGVLVGTSKANGLNDSGGLCGNTAFGVGERGRGFVLANGVLRIIPTFGGTWSGTAAINRLGQVTGTAALTGDAIPAPHYHAFIYRDKVMQSIGTLGGKLSAASDINDAGSVVGWAETTPVDGEERGERLPFLYSGGVMISLGALGGGDYGVANGLNNTGAVVGEATADTPDGPASHAFLYEDGTLHDLNDLAALPAGWTLAQAIDINDARQILALACLFEDCQYVRLDPSGP